MHRISPTSYSKIMGSHEMQLLAADAGFWSVETQGYIIEPNRSHLDFAKGTRKSPKMPKFQKCTEFPLHLTVKAKVLMRCNFLPPTQDFGVSKRGETSCRRRRILECRNAGIHYRTDFCPQIFGHSSVRAYGLQICKAIKKNVF